MHRRGQSEEEPLEFEYIMSRVDTDDPIRGYQVRTSAQGWLQGFCWVTTFTTWTHFFKWDSKVKHNFSLAGRILP